MMSLLICAVLLHAVATNEAADNVVLTSSLIDDGRQFACPGELVTFTCQVYDGFFLRWDSPLITPITYSSTRAAPSSTPSPPFLATLTSRIGSGPANFTSTLQVNASSSLSNTDTTVECRNQASDSEQLDFATPVRPAAPNITVDRVERATGGGSVTIWVSWIQSPNLDQFDIDHYDITVTSTSGVQHMTTECGESTNATLTNVTEVRSNVQLNTIFTVTITATSRCNETSPPANDFYPLRLMQCSLGSGYFECTDGTCVRDERDCVPIVMRFSSSVYSQNENTSPLSVRLVLDTTSGTTTQQIIGQLTASAQPGDTATEGVDGDFMGTTCMVTFANGSEPGAISTPLCDITIINDLMVEQRENFSLSASVINSNGLTVQFSAGGDSASCIIIDDDASSQPLLGLTVWQIVLIAVGALVLVVVIVIIIGIGVYCCCCKKKGVDDGKGSHTQFPMKSKVAAE